ncbi:hypothetical protein [Paraburkholderia sp. RL17-381-BIF-C]|uniref:hypothetical protein n=1 Tax=Paraburkholderia sp. RL17-381-BIF-C TaxID=3031635 RepID=UPI0038B8743B
MRIADAAAAIARTVEPKTDPHESGLASRWNQELLQGFLRGDLKICSSTGGLPIRAGDAGAIVGALTTGVVSLVELNRWLASMGSGIEVTVETIAANPKAQRPTSGAQVVRDAAARMADEWANEHFVKTGEIPSEEIVSKAIRVKLNAVFEQDWSHQTIRRHSLKDWSFSVISLTAQSAQVDQP